MSFELASEIPGLGGAAETWVETLDGTAEPLARYVSGSLTSRTALTENKVGDGRALYLGWYPTVEQAAAILDRLAEQDDINRLASDLPAGIALARRGPYAILLNFTDAQATVPVGDQLVTVGPRDATVTLLWN